MEAVIELILKGEVDSRQLISWLNFLIEIPALCEFDHIKEELVPYFLNYIRDEANSILHTSNHTILTPVKSTAQLKTVKSFSPTKLSRKLTPRKRTSKAKTLNFSEGSHDSSKSWSNSLPDMERSYEYSEASSTKNLQFRTPKKYSVSSNSFNLNESPVTSSHARYNTSTPRNESGKWFSKKSVDNSSAKLVGGNYVRKSEVKSVLGDYIDLEISPDHAKLMDSGGGDCVKLEVNNSSSEVSGGSCPNLEDKDVFPIVGSLPQNKISIKKKRINPTRVTGSGGNSELCTKNNSAGFGMPRKQVKHDAFISATETKSNSLEYERKLLKEERKRFQNGIACDNSLNENFPHSKLGIAANKGVENVNNEIPSLLKVTYKGELNNLAEVYSSFILLNMVPNIMVELHFLVQLLTIEEKFIKHDLNKDSYLSTVHDCVYFSVRTLSLLTNCLFRLDRSLLKVLSENTRVTNFDVNFKEKLSVVIEKTPFLRNYGEIHPKSPILSVSFQSETDNKQNFPSTIAFQVFRKQRDLFYEVLRCWEDNHLIPGWSFAQALANKVKYMLNLKSDPTNLTHLSRLFQSQLLTMCKGDEKMNLGSDAEDVIFLCELKKQQPAKYKRLFERLVMPSKFGGPVPAPSFPGSQEFFKSFIKVAFDHSFNLHLKNVMISKLAELNDFILGLTEMEDKENLESLRDELIYNIQTLRLLGKFVGFIEFLPYQNEEQLPDHIMRSQINIRNKITPSLCLFTYLKRGVTSGSLIVVVPWVIEVLSMVDSVALHTRTYLTLVFELMLIYRILHLFRLDNFNYKLCEKCDLSSQMRVVNTGNSFALKLLIGWFLNLPNVPEGLFYTSEDDADIDTDEYISFKEILNGKYSQICLDCLYKVNTNEQEKHHDGSPVKGLNTVASLRKYKMTPTKCIGKSPITTPSKYLECSMIDTPNITPDKLNMNECENISRELILDTLNVVDSDNITVFCPFVNELKGILNDFSVGNSRATSGTSVRKITPLSAPEKMGEVSGKKLQNLLEENFFHNQPSASKKTVDFVVERIFSNISRNFRSGVFPRLKNEYFQKIHSYILSTVLSNSSDNVTESIEKYIQQLCSEISLNAKQEVMKHMSELLEENTLKTNLKFLLPESSSQNSLDICYKVVKRSASEKVASWMNTHITSSFCLKELTSEGQKFLKQVQKNNLNNSSALDISGVCNGSNSNLQVNNAGYISVLEDVSMDVAADNSVARMSKNEVQNAYSVTKNKMHSKDLISPSKLLFSIKNDLKFMLSSKEIGFLSEVEILQRITLIKRVMEERHDITVPMCKAIETLTADWMAALCVTSPNLITNDMLQNFINLWLPQSEGGVFQKPLTLGVFLSPRNVTLLGQRKEHKQTLAWKKMEEFLLKVIKAKLVSLSQVQEWCLFLMRSTWPQAILCGISDFIKGFINKLSNEKGLNCDEEFIQLMDWVSWITSDMDNLNFNT